MNDALKIWRASLTSLRIKFETAPSSRCEAVLTHRPDVPIPEGWSRSPKRDIRGGQRGKLSEYRRDRFKAIPGGKPLPPTDWARWWDLSGPSSEVSRLVGLARDASLLMKSLDQQTHSDDWVFRFTHPPFEYLSEPARWLSTVFELAWGERWETSLRAPRWAWSPVPPYEHIELTNGDDWARSAAEQCSPFFAEGAELADRAGWWFSRIDDFALASVRAIDLILAELDKRADQQAEAAGQVVDAVPAGSPGQPAGGGESKPKKTKRITTKGNHRDNLIAALTKHHKYAEDSALNLDPIGNNELADLAGVSRSTASLFFKRQFNGYAEYESKCGDVNRLIPALKLLNQEYTVSFLFGDAPPDDF